MRGALVFWAGTVGLTGLNAFTSSGVRCVGGTALGKDEASRNCVSDCKVVSLALEFSGWLQSALKGGEGM